MLLLIKMTSILSEAVIKAIETMIKCRPKYVSQVELTDICTGSK
jgi:hypothetical protein